MALTFPPVIDAWHCWKNATKYKFIGGLDNFIDQYRKLTRNFYKENNIPLADIDKSLRRACQKYSADKIILPDGIHVTALANRIIVQTVIVDLNKSGLFSCEY